MSIVKLKSLASFNIELEHLDLADNRIANLREVKCLESLKFLKNVYFRKNDEESNPMCANLSLYYSEFLLIGRHGNLKIDDMTADEVSEFINNSTALKKSSTNNVDHHSTRNNYDNGRDDATISKAEEPHNQTPQPRDPPPKEASKSKYRQLDELNRKLIAQKSFPEKSGDRQDNQWENHQTASRNFGVDDEDTAVAQQFPMHLLPSQLKPPTGSDSKVSPFNLEKKVVELNDLLAFKDSKFKEKEKLLKETILSQQEKISSLEKTIDTLRADSKQTHFERDQLQEKLAFLLQETSKKSTSEYSLLDKLEHERQANFDLMRKMEKVIARNERLEHELKDSQDRTDKLVSALNQKEDQLEYQKQTFGSAIKDSQTKLETAEGKIHSLEEKIKHLNGEVQATTYSKLTLEANERAQVQSQRVQFEKEKLELEKKYNAEMFAFKEQIASLYNQHNKEKNQLESEFQESLGKMEEEYKSVIIELDQKNTGLKKDIASVQTQLVSLSARSAIFVEGSFGEEQEAGGDHRRTQRGTENGLRRIQRPPESPAGKRRKRRRGQTTIKRRSLQSQTAG